MLFSKDVFGLVVNSEGKHSGRSNHHSPKVKLANSHAYDYPADYGVELPNFAYDFSELFLNAMVTRTTYSTDLYLHVMLLGHQTIHEDYPFEAINTDDKYFLDWRKTSEHWPVENGEAHTVHQAKRSQYYCLLHNPIQEPTDSMSSSHHKGGSSSHHVANTYQVHAQWLRVNTDHTTTTNTTNTKQQQSSLHRYYDILRCKLRSSHLIYQQMTELIKRKRRLFVDIIHLSTDKANTTTENTGSTYAVVLNGGAGATNTGNTGLRVQQTTLISFNLPWNQRNIGYPALHSMFGMLYDQLAVQKVITVASSTSITPAVVEESGKERKKNMVVVSNKHQYRMTACVSNVRPLYSVNPYTPTSPGTTSGRQNIQGIPMLLEYIEHLLLLGVDQIVLGIELSWDSYYMKRYISVLSEYLQSGVVTILSMTDSVPNFEDIPGFYGIQLHDTFASIFFYQECLNMHKGLSEYLLLLQVNQFVVPNISSSASINPLQKPLHSLIQEAKRLHQPSILDGTIITEDYQRVFGSYGYSKYAHHSSSSSSSLSSTTTHNHRHGNKNKKAHDGNEDIDHETIEKRRYLRSQQTTRRLNNHEKNNPTHDIRVGEYDCSIRFHPGSFYGISDSTLTSLFSWGPGDTKWLRDYYASPTISKFHTKMVHTLTSPITIVHVDSTLSIDLPTADGKILPICDLHYIQHQIRLGKAEDTLIRRSTVVPSADVTVFIVQEMFDSQHVVYQLPPNSEEESRNVHSEADKAAYTAELTAKLTTFQRYFQSTLANALTVVTAISPLSSVQTIEKRISSFNMDYVEKVSLENGGKQLQLSNVLKGIKDRRHINEPFWQLCNTKKLHDALSRAVAIKERLQQAKEQPPQT